MTVSYHLPGSLPPSRERCDWHYLVAVVNANGSVSPCCGVQEEAFDFGSVADGRPFVEVWHNAHFRSARRHRASPGCRDGVSTVCERCPIPEDQSRVTDRYVEPLLRRAPRAVRKRAIERFPALRGRLTKLLRRPRRRGRFDAQRWDNLLLALEDRAAGVERPRSQPIGLILDPSSACGLRCPFCPVSYSTEVRQKTLLDQELFDRVLAELGPALFFVDFFNWGEPLLHKNLPRMLERLRSYEIKVRISSSLSLPMSDALIESLVDNLDVLTASIDGCSQEVYELYRRRGDVGLALSNLERIARIKKRRRSRTHVEWQYLVFSTNERELEPARKLARAIGVTFRPAAPFIEVSAHADWLADRAEFVMPRYARLYGARKARRGRGTALEQAGLPGARRQRAEAASD